MQTIKWRTNPAMKPDIAKAKGECEQAWKDHPKVKAAWCCHHSAEIEPLVFPAQDRIDYIIGSKDEEELVTRFNNFRPVISQLPEDLGNQIEDLVTLETEWMTKNNAAIAENKASGNHEGEASKQFAEVNDRWQHAWLKYKDTIKRLSDQLKALHKIDVPNHTWNGSDIFN